VPRPNLLKHWSTFNLPLSRYEFARLSVEKLTPKLVVDIGAADGRMKQAIELTGSSWMGFDLAPQSPHVTGWDLLDECPTPNLQADAVLLLDVIEHLANPGVALRRIAEILKPEGHLIMTMPNPRWSRSRIHALISGYPTCFTESDLELNGHMFTPWPHILFHLLSAAGFGVEDYVTIDGWTQWPGRPFGTRYPLRCAHAIANTLIEYFDSSACGMSYGTISKHTS